MHKKALIFSIIVALLMNPSYIWAKTYQLSSLPYLGWAPYNIADVKGFWEEEGVKVEVTIFSSSPDYIKAVTSSPFDFIPVPLASIVDFNNAGLDLVFTGTLDIANGFKQLILKKSLENKNLAGQLVGSYGDESSSKFLLAKYLKSVGNNLNDVRIVTMSNEDLASNFIFGRIKAAVFFGPLKEKALIEGDGFIAASTLIPLKKNSSQSIYTLDAYGLTMPRGKYNKIPPEDLKRIFRGWIRAVKWMKNPKNEREFHQILNTYTFRNLPTFSTNTLNAMATETKFLSVNKLQKFNKTDIGAHLIEIRTVLADNGILKGKQLERFTINNIIKNKSLIEVLGEKNMQ